MNKKPKEDYNPFKRYYDERDLEYFFSNYNEVNSIIVLLLTLFTGTFYLVYWIYKTNEKFLEIDKDAPHPMLAIYTLFLFPITWFFLNISIKKLIFHINKDLFVIMFFTNLKITGALFIYGVFELVIWFMLAYFALVYLFKFSLTYSRITNTSVLIWFNFLSAEIFGLVFLFIGYYKLILLSFLTIIVVPAMQEKLNSEAKRYKMKKLRKIDYQYGSYL